MSSLEHITTQLSPYLDGELSPGSARAVETHLRACADCRDQLQQMRQMSEVLRGLRQPLLSSGQWERLHAGVDALAEEDAQARRMERGVLQIARVLTGIAACLLVAGSLWLAGARSGEPAISHTSLTGPVAEWEVPAVTLEPKPEATATVASIDTANDWVAAGFLGTSAVPGGNGRE